MRKDTGRGAKRARARGSRRAGRVVANLECARAARRTEGEDGLSAGRSRGGRKRPSVHCPRADAPAGARLRSAGSTSAASARSRTPTRSNGRGPHTARSVCRRSARARGCRAARQRLGVPRIAHWPVVRSRRRRRRASPANESQASRSRFSRRPVERSASAAERVGLGFEEERTRRGGIAERLRRRRARKPSAGAAAAIA